MTDPLSVIAGVTGVIGFGIQSTKALYEFCRTYRDLDASVSKVTDNLDRLRHTLEALDAVIKQRAAQSATEILNEKIILSIKRCDSLIHKLDAHNQRLRKSPSKTSPTTPSTRLQTVIKTNTHKVLYPFHKKTLDELDTDIRTILGHLSLAVDTLLLYNHGELGQRLGHVRAAQISSEIQDWLKAPDASSNHNAALDQRHADTGRWFLESDAFHAWLTRENSFLWMRGFAGCGKTVLCSTTIQNIRDRRDGTDVGIAYFYFSFADDSNRDEKAMLRAFILQLAWRSSSGHEILNDLYQQCKPHAASTRDLISCLHLLIGEFSRVYLLVDALDECPQQKKRQPLLDTICTIRQWFFAGLHFLVTARNEPDIRRSLAPVEYEEVPMRNIHIDQDIESYISNLLETDPKLQRLKGREEHPGQIKKTLATKAEGMFRWVDCQLRALKSCKPSTAGLRTCLRTLPKDLDETYERMLRNIDEAWAEDARRLFTFLCFSKQPLSPSQIMDAMAVNLDDPPRFDIEDRIEDEDWLCEICPGFIEIVHGRYSIEVRLAHYSVQEYLVSTRMLGGPAELYALSEDRANVEMAKVCLIYLRQVESMTDDHHLQIGYNQEVYDEDFPFVSYAAFQWMKHCEMNVDGLDDFLLVSFRNGHLDRWIDYPSDPSVGDSNISPMYCASRSGLERLVIRLIAETDAASQSQEVNAKGGHFGSALQVAAFYGSKEIVQILLEAGADINAQSGFYGNALQAASVRGSEAVVKQLLAAGAKVNAQNGFFGNALQAASIDGRETVVKQLLAAGAKVNAQSGFFGNALQAASARGSEAVVKQLLATGANVNVQGGYHGNALQAASASGSEAVVKQVLDAGADVNANGYGKGNALYKASLHGHETVVKQLLAAKANPNFTGGRHGSALRAARFKGHEKIAEILLAAGAIDTRTESEKEELEEELPDSSFDISEDASSGFTDSVAEPVEREPSQD